MNSPQFALLASALERPPSVAKPSVIAPITDSMMAGDLRACGERAIAALESGVSDIRAVAGFLLGIFHQRGPEALPEISDVLGEVLTKQRHAGVAETSGNRVADSCLVLLFRVLRTSVEFHETQRDQEWQRWALTMPPDLAQTSMLAFRQLSTTLNATFEKARSVAELDRLCVRAESLFLPKPPCRVVPAPAEGEAPDSSVLPHPPPTLPDPPNQLPPAEAEQAPERLPAVGWPWSSPVSPQFELFLRKLSAFATLVERGQMDKAALVAADLGELIDHFDPRVYFPAMLAPHFRILNEHIQDIAPHWNRGSDPVWQAQQQLYRVDLDAFLESQ